jgi:hypothetical protein
VSRGKVIQEGIQSYVGSKNPSTIPTLSRFNGGLCPDVCDRDSDGGLSINDGMFTEEDDFSRSRRGEHQTTGCGKM